MGPEKKAQIKLSFSFIVSIILIIIFIAAGIYGIKKMLDLKNEVQVKQFKQALQQDVNTLWNSEIGSKKHEYILPSKIKEVCFQNETENMYFNPLKFGRYEIKHIKVNNLTCIKTKDGKVSFFLEKTYDSPLVKIRKISNN